MSARASRFTATLAGLLLSVALIAVLFSIVRAWVPVPGRAGPPRGGDAVLYEVARPSDDLAVQVGPNHFSVAAVVRNDRDGSIRVEDGRGKPTKGPGFTPNAVVTGQAGWLDVANIYLNPGPTRFDVIELRVFDHKTRRLLSGSDGMGASYDPSKPPVVQIVGLGERLPDSVDVWFRASSHEPGEPVVALKGEAGASAECAGRSISVREIWRGARSYSTRATPGSTRVEYNWTSPPGESDQASTVVFDWDGKGVAGRYQICAVGRDGRKVFADIPHFLNFQSTPGTEAIHFRIAAGDLSHFELRPFGDRHTFYFDDVKLPVASRLPFVEAPVVRLRVDGGELERTLSEYSPVRVRLVLKKGAYSDGISSDGFLTKTPVEHLQTAFTVLLDVEGIAGDIWELTYLDRDGRPIDVRSGGRATRTIMGGSHGHREAATYHLPLDRIGEIEVRAGRRPD